MKIIRSVQWRHNRLAGWMGGHAHERVPNTLRYVLMTHASEKIEVLLRGVLHIKLSVNRGAITSEGVCSIGPASNVVCNCSGWVQFSIRVKKDTSCGR